MTVSVGATVPGSNASSKSDGGKGKGGQAARVDHDGFPVIEVAGDAAAWRSKS